MSIEKRKGSEFWYVNFTAPGGQRIRQSTGTKEKRKAQEYHDRLKAQLWSQAYLGVEPDKTFEEAALRMLKLSEGQNDYRTKLQHVEYWLTVFAGRSIRSLKSDEITDNLPTHRRSVTHKKAVPLANATKNRYLSTIGRILSLAEEAGWISQKPKLTAYKEKKVNIRWLRKEEANKLLSKITLRWLHDCAVFALATGCRANEIFTLTWDKVNIQNKTAWITNDLAKSGMSRSIPLNDDALRVILTRPKISPYIFCRNSGLQLTEIDREHFNNAIRNAGLAHLTFHDLRHTWASWHVQSGTPLMVLKELGGWETIEMVMKYAHLAKSHLAEFASASELTQNWHSVDSGNKKAA